MKTSMAGIVSAVVLTVLTGAGFGIAQAGGVYTEGPVSSFEDQDAQHGIEEGGTANVQEAPEWVNPSAKDFHMAPPAETGSLPDSVSPSNKWGGPPSSNRDDIDAGGGGY